MLPEKFQRNKKIYLAYNQFRKDIFTKLNPRDSDVILRLLPWVLNENHPSVPGYIEDLPRAIKVHNLRADEAVRKGEGAFRTLFHLKKEPPLLRAEPQAWWIQGIYTIGSLGTISQTSRSDCDIWICIDREEFGEEGMGPLFRKINLIKDWLDATIKISVYFFICDIEDIRRCNFGDATHESSGSAQRNVLKEEFYRTMLLICGKIPLWWVCHDGEAPVDYEALQAAFERGVFGSAGDFIDLGNLDLIEKEEYFGAALWQFNKALTHPLKSITKMLLLQMFLASPRGRLLCHRFRECILNQGEKMAFTDPSAFTMEAVLAYNRGIDPDTFEFISKCFYLRYDLKLNSRKLTIKEELAKAIFQRFTLGREEIYRLNEFHNWRLQDQTAFGSRAIMLLLTIYKDITARHRDVAGGIKPQDLTIIGRKLSACLEKKSHKVPVLHKPVENLNQPTFLFRLEGKKWQIVAGDDPSALFVENPDIVNCLSYLVWNDLFDPGRVRMMPNATSVTMQEIISLGRKIREVFGTCDVTTIDFNNFLDSETINDMVVVINFEGEYNRKDLDDFCVLYSNNWGELFLRRFRSPDAFRESFNSREKKFKRMQIHYYIQRNSLYYDKIIERTKRVVMGIFAR